MIAGVSQPFVLVDAMHRATLAPVTETDTANDE